MSLALPFQTAKQLAAAVRKKKIGCLELLDLYLKRVEAYNPELNAIIATDIEGARKRAKAADRAIKAGKKLGPLHGVPMTIKESFDVTGFSTTWGDPAFKDTVAAQNSLVAQRMTDAGVTLFGKTNIPLNLADWQSYNEVYGSTNNPWDLGRTPGGSSGGSGAALAAGLTGIEAGSDIGASIRNPAHYCGVWGHKPSWGVVSPKGHALAGAVAYGDIGVVGPLARGAEDLEIALTAMAGPDAIDGRGWTLTLPRSQKTKLRDFKVGVLLTDPNAEVDDSVQEQISKLASFLAKNKVKGERQGTARNRHGRAERRLYPPAAGGDLGPHERRGLRAGRERRREPAGKRHELFRPDAARQCAVASHLAQAEREAPQDAARLG